eukprot:CAMPEP_0177651790 /NCGR_PEP_ID=MMETSP0447-20121125/12748_1 /TAXON_ID=0 /ORGANISM="Stygamoeba regulata, Strain BSH-02190019" /LENGTH=299 /DNA_ID=CAMNT_0019154919 /DNA_START=502 /DNA_END=1401 /DNA_ORIENTATION=-
MAATITATSKRLRVSQKLERVDLLQIKSKLVLALDERAPMYLDTIRRFAQAQLSKRELDDTVKTLLGPSKMALHNQFILSILNNAHCSEPPPSSSDSLSKLKKQKRRRQKPERPTKKSRSKIRFASVVMEGSSDMPRYLAPKRPRHSTAVVRVPPQYPAATHARSQERDRKLMHNPALLALRHKMVKTANESGVSEVDNTSVRYMMSALEHHIKEILVHCAPYVKTTATPPTPPQLGEEIREPSVTGDPDFLNNELCLLDPPAPPHTVTTSDLAAAVQITPSVLGESFPINQERIVLMP